MISQIHSTLRQLVLLAIILVVSPALTAQLHNQYNLPVKHGNSSSSGGPGGGTSQYYGRLIHFTNPYSLEVDYYTDYDNYHDFVADVWNYQTNDYPFQGTVEFLNDRTVIRMPASSRSSYAYRELSIGEEGRVLQDVYYLSGEDWKEYHYSYNEQGALISETMISQNPQTRDQVTYIETAYNLDANNMRVSGTISISTDASTWIPIGSMLYEYSDEPQSEGLDFEKSLLYLPREWGLLALENFVFPYVCNQMKLQSMTYTLGEADPIVYQYTYHQDSYNFYYSGGLYGFEFIWNNLGKLLRCESSVDVSYTYYAYQWQTIALSNSDQELPQVQAELKVFPNPFNPSTTVSYTLNKPAEPVISIYNLKGQLLRRYNQGPQQAGSFNVVFDGRDSAGTELPCGLYLIQMNLGGQTLSKKITLLK